MTNVDSQRIKEIRDNTRAMAEAFGRIADTLAEALELFIATKTETQNSNLTFEKDECAKEYEELGLKELKELIEADRKTEPTISKMEQVDKDINVRSKDEPSDSEKPNNCECITEDGVTCAKYPACDDCLDNPLNKVKGSERLLKGKDEPQKKEAEWVYNKRERLWYPYSNGEPLFKDEPMKTTDYCDICKRDMCEDCIADATNPYCVPSHYEINYEPKDEPLDKDINVRSKDEPQTEKGGCTNCDGKDLCNNAFTEISQYCGAYEPQNGYQTFNGTSVYVSRLEDEPQTDNGIGCSRCGGRYDCYDRDMPHAVRCNNYGKITDEPQTERSE